MRKIVVLDTWVNDTNLGNKIIMDAVYAELRRLFPHDFFYQVPLLEHIRAGRGLVRQGDYVFLGGTNVLSADMNKSTGWPLGITDAFWMRNVILFGVGWWQYQSYAPRPSTRFVLKRILNKEHSHSVRDAYTAARLKALGFKVLNTGCPTLWPLTKAHCEAIPRTNAQAALLTFTEYRQNPKDDRLLFEIVKRNYASIYFWPQMHGDYDYAKRLCDSQVIFVDPSVEALDDLLHKEDVDYVGTRLHAGIRALQHRRRTIIIAVDNRATEMNRDFNLPTVPREKSATELDSRIKSSWATQVILDQHAIAAWRQQFATLVDHPA